eukprot:1160901-Pelagomonas_calceolata.AAC.9
MEKRLGMLLFVTTSNRISHCDNELGHQVAISLALIIQLSLMCRAITDVPVIIKPSMVCKAVTDVPVII